MVYPSLNLCDSRSYEGLPEDCFVKSASAGVMVVWFSIGGECYMSPNPAGQLQTLTTRVTHVLPVSDDGGSTAEIVRVLGGPAVGDIRSRCLRLADDSNEEVKIRDPLQASKKCYGDMTEPGCTSGRP